MIDKIEPHAALHRYFIWASRMRHDFLKAGPPPSGTFDIQTWSLASSTYFGYWLGALYVVVEGWKNLRISYPPIDQLLGKSDYVALLRRFRNGMFHFQSRYNDRRFRDVYNGSDDFLVWASKLHDEFGRWCIDWLKSLGLEFEGEFDNNGLHAITIAFSEANISQRIMIRRTSLVNQVIQWFRDRIGK